MVYDGYSIVPFAFNLFEVSRLIGPWISNQYQLQTSTFEGTQELQLTFPPFYSSDAQDAVSKF